jgi:hypothetical protein
VREREREQTREKGREPSSVSSVDGQSPRLPHCHSHQLWIFSSSPRGGREVEQDCLVGCLYSSLGESFCSDGLGG